MSEIYPETPVNEGSETTLGKIYWDEYASSDPAYDGMSAAGREESDDLHGFRLDAADEALTAERSDVGGAVQNIELVKTWISWDRRMPPPWRQVAEAVTALSGGTVLLREGVDVDGSEEPDRVFVVIERGAAPADAQPAPELAALRLGAVRAILLDGNTSDQDARSRAAAAAYDGNPQPAEAPGQAGAKAGEALAADNAKLRERLARVLGWFTEEAAVSSRRYASVTRAQLASAYQDGGLTVPEELRRFL